MKSELNYINFNRKNWVEILTKLNVCLGILEDTTSLIKFEEYFYNDAANLIFSKERIRLVYSFFDIKYVESNEGKDIKLTEKDLSICHSHLNFALGVLINFKGKFIEETKHIFPKGPWFIIDKISYCNDLIIENLSILRNN